MTVYTDNLIAEGLDLDKIEQQAKAVIAAFESEGLGRSIIGDGRPGNGTTTCFDFDGEGGFVVFDFMDSAPVQMVALIAGYRAALDAVQPVTPDVEPVTDEALWDFANDLLGAWNIEDENPPGLLEDFRDRFVARFGVLGQPQPQPDRAETVTRLADALHADGCADDDCDGGEMSHYERQAEVAFDALLPLLGQPRTDTPTPAEVIDWIAQAAEPIHYTKLDKGTFAVVVIDAARKYFASPLASPISESPHPLDAPAAAAGLVRAHAAPGRVRYVRPVEQDQARYPRTDTTGGE